jgi:hypothetical protein
MFQNLLEEARRKFGDPPRRFDGEEVRAMRSPPPDFMQSNPRDPLWLQFRQRQAIFSHGELVWGQVVQANSILYDDADPHDAPAAYIYSLDTDFEEDVMALAEIADNLYGIRGETTDNPQTQPCADMLGDGYARNLLAQVPYDLTDGRDVYYTCGVIPRKYLPLPQLAAPLFPLIIVPGKTEATWLLPSRWWPQELIDMWLDALNS